MTATVWCTHCQATVTVESDTVYGQQLTCPECQQRFVASDAAPDEELNLADIEMDALEDDPFGELASLSPEANSLQPMQLPLMAIPTPREKIGPDGLTDSQRRHDLIVRIIGYSLIGITVIVWIVVGMRPHDGMSPLYVWIPGSFPVLLMGLLIGVYGAVFDEESRRTKRRSLIVVGVSLGVILVLGVAMMLFPANSKPSAVQGMNVMGALFAFGVAGVALCLGLAGLLTGQSFWKILSEMGQRD